MSTAAYHALCRDVTYHFIFVRIFSHCNISTGAICHFYVVDSQIFENLTNLAFCHWELSESTVEVPLWPPCFYYFFWILFSESWWSRLVAKHKVFDMLNVLLAVVWGCWISGLLSPRWIMFHRFTFLSFLTTLVATRRCQCLLRSAWVNITPVWLLFVISGILAGGIPGFRIELFPRFLWVLFVFLLLLRFPLAKRKSGWRICGSSFCCFRGFWFCCFNRFADSKDPVSLYSVFFSLLSCKDRALVRHRPHSRKNKWFPNWAFVASITRCGPLVCFCLVLCCVFVQVIL